MESFYGGRQGISFIIVKHFDGIDIPKDTSFTVKYFAFDTSENNFILDENNNPIERTNDTYKLYNDWKLHEKDGSSITYKEKEGVFPSQYAEGMVQCFSQGGITTNIVNYGEYVIIDTPNKNDLDNGKVYRRGLDYQNDLGGAEYIGQIIGPTGSSPEIYMDSFTTLVSEGGPQISYENDDIIPGVELDSKGNPKYDENGNPVKGNNIQSSWVTIRDQFGVVTGCKIGFQFPYHIFDFTAEGVSPYTTGELVERIDDKQYPYFSKWKISVPKGIKGDAFDNLHIVNSVAKKDIPYYKDIDCTIKLGTLSQEIPIEIQSEYYTDEIDKGKPILESGVIRYVKEEDGDRQVLIYKEITFDQKPEGDVTYHILGEYNIIEHIDLVNDGTLIIDYTYNDTKVYDKLIKWIDKVTFDRDNGQITIFYNTGETKILNEQDDEKIKWIDEIYLDADGKLKVKYNLDQNNFHVINTNNPIQWINNVNLTADGKLEITYNTQAQPTIINPDNSVKWIDNIIFNDNEGIIKIIYNTEQPNADGIKEGIPLNTDAIKWLTNVKLTDNGEIKIKYNTDTPLFDGHSINANDKIRWIKHDTDTNEYGIKINTDIDENGNDLGEGFGSQKIQITYNTGETHEIGRPINYIIESIITKDRELLDDNYREDTGQLKSKVAKNNHLLIIYSDPSLRAQLQADTIWKSKKLGYFEQWYDMGEVKGDPGTVKIATTITSLEAETLLVDNNPPENILNDTRYEGWLIGVQDSNSLENPIILYYYDYENNHWQELGDITSSAISMEPEKIVQIDSVISEDLSNITLEEKGILFIKEKNQNVITNLRQRNENGFGNPCYFGSFAKYIFSTLNSGVSTLEQQLLIGCNKIIEEWIDENENNHIKTKFLIDDSTLEYYILHSITYDNSNDYSNILISNSKVIFNNNQDQNVELKGQDKYGNNSYSLKLNNLNMYSVDNNKLSIAPSILIKEDILSICEDGIEENATNLYKKQTLIQITGTGHKITQEKIINLYN